MELTRGWDLPAASERPDFDVLVVAGDLITKMERGVAWLLARVANCPVIYVAGNHEFYGCDIDRTVEKARALAAGTNVHVLQNNSILIDGVTFIGATFWTDFDLFGDPDYAMMVAAETMNDYRKIRLRNYQYRLRPQHTLARHRESRDFIASELRKPKTTRRVVVTHMGPHPDAVRRGFERDIASAAYTSDCSDLMAMGVDAWIYGHTHEHEARKIGAPFWSPTPRDTARGRRTSRPGTTPNSIPGSSSKSNPNSQEADMTDTIDKISIEIDAANPVTSSSSDLFSCMYPGLARSTALFLFQQKLPPRSRRAVRSFETRLCRRRSIRRFARLISSRRRGSARHR